MAIAYAMCQMAFAFAFGQIIKSAIKSDFKLLLIYSGIGLLIPCIMMPCSYWQNVSMITLNKMHNMHLRSVYYNNVLTEDFNKDLITSEFINSSSTKIMQLENNYFLNNLNLISYLCTLIFAMAFITYYSWIIFIATCIFSVIIFLLPFAWTKLTQKKLN